MSGRVNRLKQQQREMERDLWLLRPVKHCGSIIKFNHQILPEAAGEMPQGPQLELP